MRPLIRCVLSMMVTGVLALAALAAGATPALAHANLETTDPPYGVALAPAPDRVLIRYDLPVEVSGAQIKLERSGTAVRVGRPVHASSDHRLVSLPLTGLAAGNYLLTWFLFGTDGDVMGGELAFRVLAGPGAPAASASTASDSSTSASPASASPASASPASASSAPASSAPASSGLASSTPASSTPTFSPFSRAQDAARLMGFASLALLIGGVAFTAGLWPAGARLRRTRVVLWAALGTAVVANAASLGLKGAAVTGRSALEAFTPAAVTALDGTHVGRVLTARLGFLLLAVPVVAILTVAPQRALRSHRWFLGAAGSGVGALATHGMLSHAYGRGVLASAADAVHLGAVSLWLGGLFMLAAVVLPRRRRAELADVVPRWSRLAFASMAAAVGAGAVLLVLISPRWTALPTTGYGRFLLLKLVGVVALLVVAHRAREFARRRLPGLVAAGEIDLVVEELVTAPALVGAGVGGTSGAVPAPSPVGAGVAGTSGPLPAPSPVITPDRERALAGRGSPPVVEPAALRPFLNAVALELTMAASILATTAILVGRPPPA